MKRIKSKFTRRNFLKSSAFITGAAGAAGYMVGTNPELEVASATAAEGEANRTTAVAQCPYCGVGCGTIIQAENGKIVSMRPDKDHPTNFGLQCIKGLTAAEPLYVDRMEGDSYVRKDVWAEWNKPNHGDLGFVSKTKGSFDEEHFVRVPYEEASELVDHKIAYLAKKHGGNSIGLYGSGQLTMEGQYMENMFMKGVLSSNTIEANARMCMTSAVTGYFATLGSDTPPLAYEDIEMADMIMHFGHNAREAHPIIFWRCADHKKKKDIPTVIVDPRRTGTVMGYEDINPKNSVHVPILNGDIAFLNAIAHVLLKDHDDVIDWDFVKQHATGWKTYVDGVLNDYSPEQVQDRMGGPNHDVSPELIRRVAGMFADATRKRLARAKGTQEGGYGGVIIMWGIGYNQHVHGQYNVISIINLLTLTGNLAKPGCGPFSMTGQPNAMGERFTGGLTGRLPFNQPLKNAKHRAHMAKQWGVPEKNLIAAMKSKNPGYAIGMMERALKGEVKAFFFVYATHIDLPDLFNLVRPAITKTFNVVQEIYRHAPNNLYADVIFLAATWGEVEGIYVSSERRLNICRKAAEPPEGCRPDLDMVIDKARGIGKLLGLDMDKALPYQRKEDGFYDAQEIFRDILEASVGSDTDLTGILEVEKLDKIAPYDQIEALRGIQWPAPTYEIAQNGGTKRRFMLQEGWANKPYGYFRTKDGKVHMKLCKQDYSDRERLTKELMRFGAKGEDDFLTIDHMDLIKEARDKGMTPDMPDEEHRGKKWQDVPEDKYPYWFGLGVVYEHFHTSKSFRSPTTRRLVPEMYLEMHPDDAKDLGIKDGDKLRVHTRRGSLEARAQVGTNSLVKPSRNGVPRGYMFGPWNLSVADSADPKKNKWLANGTTSRVWDPVSGQVDFKKSACRIEKI